ncbi:MAG: M20/M25/M40 family metallo-hydrolase [Chloroflexota bacterium]
MKSADLVTLIEELAQTYGPTGREAPVRDLVRRAVEGRADEMHVSHVGSLHALVNKGGGRRMMLTAHMDEIGVIVSHIDTHGYARFHPMGGVDMDTCVGHRVRFATGAMAVIGVEKRKDRSKSPTIEQLFLDFGAGGPADCPVAVGDIGAFDRPFLRLGQRVVSKALDDRVGVAVLIETIRRLDRTPHEVQFVFTVQEEFTSAGGKTSAFALEPEVALAVDVANTGDTPRGPKIAAALGKGPMIKVRDSGMVSDPRLVDLLARRASAAKIPHQFEVVEGITTDGADIQVSRSGVVAAGISIPCRYIHTPSEMVDLGDVENVVRLLLEVLRQPLDLHQP